MHKIIPLDCRSQIKKSNFDLQRFLGIRVRNSTNLDKHVEKRYFKPHSERTEESIQFRASDLNPSQKSKYFDHMICLKKSRFRISHQKFFQNN